MQIKIATLACLLMGTVAIAAPAPDSKRLGHAKDLIADEQWTRAIAELQAAVDDPKEANRDEALYWLADCQHQASDDAAALQTISRLEKTAPSSRWVHPARSLRIEIAQRLRRDDVLWMTAMPPRPPAPPAQPGIPPPAIAATPVAPPAPVRVPSMARPAAAPPPPPPAAPPAPFTEYWLPATPSVDMTLKLQAMTGLLDTHGAQVIPLLRAIALDPNSPDEARQAVFVLGQARRPEAEQTIVEVARTATEPVRIAAVRELGRFDSPTVSSELMQVYALRATPRLKRQIVTSLGDRADSVSLLRIAKSEPEATVRDLAIVTLGRSAPRDQVRALYAQTPAASRGAVLLALCAAKDDDELIRIATSETNPALRVRARQQLRLLATPKALKFLEENP